MTRNILSWELDENGDPKIIGQMSEPDGVTWTEQEWDERLLPYATPPPSPVIPDVTPRQIRQALILSGISLSDINTALNSLSEPTSSMALVEWEYSISFQRSRPLVASVGTMLGWTSEQLDDLWKLANTL